jgi:UDP-N-acetylglucosamine transferase subunit ALG13
VRVFVSVGTDHHPFDRLVGWAAEWARAHPDDRVVCQHGTTAPPPPVANLRAVELLDAAGMAAELHAADVVVVSCGPGAAMDTRAAGRVPVVVPRRADLGEHVDDHQQAFARHLEARGLALRVVDEDGFRAALEEVAADPSRLRMEPEVRVPSGIEGVGRLVDDLVYGRRPTRARRRS